MLTKKQLKDMARCCGGLCELCNCNKMRMAYQDCIRQAAKTALAYREMLERLEWIEHKDWLVECCPFCKKGKNQGHAPDCELAKLLKDDDI